MATTIQKVTSFFKKGIDKIKRVVLKADDPIWDVYHKNYSKAALISYLTAPFKLGVSKKHNNTMYVLEIAKMLDSMGYSVDVINFSDKREYAYDKYDVIIGFGDPFCASFNGNEKAARIYYGTGMQVTQHNHNAIQRLLAFKKRTGQWLEESARLVDRNWSLQTEAVTGMVSYGNSVVKESYSRYYNGPIHMIHNINFIFRTSEKTVKQKKDWKKARTIFSFEAGAGMIHKGLDVVLELFAKHPEWELHIAAPSQNEKRFFDFYKATLSLPNIHYYGFVEKNSSLYWNIIDSSGFFLSPSASEGCPTSLVNACSNSKIIPIATKESGLPDNAEFVIPIEGIDEKALEKAIKSAQSKSDEELEQLATKAHIHFSTAHSVENYRKELTEAVSAILAHVV